MHILLDILRSQQADDPFAFRLGHQEYIARTTSGGIRTATLGWDDELLADLAALRRLQPDPAVAPRLGARLRKFLSELGFDEEKALIAQATTAGERVTITLQLCAAELFALPWELFTLRVSGLHAGALPQVLFRYCWPELTPAAESPCPRPEGGRILMAWSAAGGAVPAAEHQSAIKRAAALGYYPFGVERDVLSNVSMDRLRAALTTREGEQPVAVLHLLCHGMRIGSTYGLAWDADDNSGGSDVIDGGRLRQLLAPFAGHLRLVVLCACDSGNSGELGNHLGSLALALQRVGLASIVASRFPLSVVGSCVLTETLYHALLVQPTSLEAAFIAARQRLIAQPDGLDWASLQLYSRPADVSGDKDDTRPLVIRPYRGLAAFQPQDHRLFFGRQPEVEEAIADLAALQKAGKPRFLVVAGASGTGKSSVVLGGMLPKLMQARTAELLPAKSRAVVTALVAELGRAPTSPGLHEVLAALQRALSAAPEGGGGWEYAVMRPGSEPSAALLITLAQRRDASRPFLLVVDQLEELFTHTADATVRQRFLQRLWTLVQGNTGISCVVTLRVDFLGQCAEVSMNELGLRLDRVAYDEAHRVFVAQMGVEQLRAAIEGPARLVGLELEEGLATLMIADVQGEPGALPLVEYVLDLLWQRRQGSCLTVDAYNKLGGAAGALGGNADRLYERLDREARKLARRLLVRLVSRSEQALGDTRRRAPLDELRAQVAGDTAAFDATVAEFVDARLLVRTEERGQILLEVAHEALLRKWQRLRDWLIEDRQLLGELSELDGWAKQFTEYKTLLQGPRLDFARQFLERHPQDVGPKVIEMVQASQRAKLRKQQRNWALVLSIGAVLGVFSLYALYERGSAREQARMATSRQLAGQSNHVRQKNPYQSLLLAAHAVWHKKDERESRSTLTAALSVTSGTRTIRREPQGKVAALAFSPGGDLLAAGDEHGAVFLYPVGSDKPPRKLHIGIAAQLYTLAFNPKGTLLAAAGQGSRVYLWDLTQGERADGAPSFTLESSASFLRAIDFSASGQWLAAAGDRGRITAWDFSSPEHPARHLTAAEAPLLYALRFFPGSGARIAVGAFGTFGGSVQLFDVAAQRFVQKLIQPDTERVEALAISPDGKWLISGGPNEAAVRWELGADPPRFTTLPDFRNPAGLFFRPDGRTAAACTTNGRLPMIDVTTGDPVEGLPSTIDSITGQLLPDPRSLHVGTSVVSCAQSADGATLALGDVDRIILWDLRTQPALHPGFYPQPQSVSALAASPDGTTLALGTATGNVSFIDIKSDRQLGDSVHVHNGAVNGLVYRADGSELISVGVDSAMFRIDTRQPARPPQGVVAEATLGSMIAVDRHGERVAVGTVNGWLLLWDVGQAPPRELLRRRLSWPGQPVVTILEVRFSPDGRTLAVAGSAAVSRWRTSDLGLFGLPLRGHEPDSLVRSVDFSPDGRLLASAASDGTVRLWNLTTEPPRIDERPLQNNGSVMAVRFSPDSKLLAAATANHGVILWNPANHQEPFGAPLVGHRHPISALVYLSDQLLFSGDDETIWRWNVDLSDGRASACSRVNSNFTKEEWTRYFPAADYCLLCEKLPAGTGAVNAKGCGP